MKSNRWRWSGAATLMAMPLAAALILGCDSPIAPKFPEPIEEPDTTKQEGEGATGRGTIGRLLGTDSDSIRRQILVSCSTVPSCRP